MLGDWDTARIGGVDYQAVFNRETSQLVGGVDRPNTLTMRTADAEAAGVVVETDVVIAGVTWQVRGISKEDDGQVTVLDLVR